MGAEIAKISLWLASFVPGLSLSYLDHNVRVGNSLIGVASPEQLLDANGGTTIPAMLVIDAMTEAADGYVGPIKVQAPGPWTLDAVHHPRPVTRYWTEMHPEPFRRGTHEFMAPSITVTELSPGLATYAAPPAGSDMMIRFSKMRPGLPVCSGRTLVTSR